jgi:hypothetical protein
VRSPAVGVLGSWSCRIVDVVARSIEPIRGPLFREGSLAHDLKVVFADLTLDQPQAAGDVDSALMFWPRGLFWPPLVFHAATDASLLLNREMIDVVQRNLNASFSLLRKVAGARSFGDVIELQSSHLSNRITAWTGQSDELATLLAKTAMEFMRGACLGHK